MLPKSIKALYARNFIFGAEDALVSTVGLLAGIATAGVSRTDILVTGMVLIFVEAFSMAAGSFSSEYETEEYIAKRRVPAVHSTVSALIMFLAYFFFGLVTIIPYGLVLNGSAYIYSIGVSLISLLILGIASAKLFKIPIWRNTLRLFIVGAIAIAVGVTVGNIVS